ncbi:MAG: PilZ domain-containing protein [Gammaproteobacteria bacterium]|nr:MAG: PilZ domain-containing protein [Gammaproteobacteria bacterium]
MVERTASGAERRRYYRIDEEVYLTHRRVASEHLDEAIARLDEKRARYCFLNDLDLAREEQLPAWCLLRERHPQVADYLLYLEKRIDAVAKHVAEHVGLTYGPKQRVNISAQGLRFYSPKPYGEEDYVELQIVLPDRRCVLVIGGVVWCVDDPHAPPEERYAVAVDFDYIHEADRELLVKHIQETQRRRLAEQAAADDEAP